MTKGYSTLYYLLFAMYTLLWVIWLAATLDCDFTRMVAISAAQYCIRLEMAKARA